MIQYLIQTSILLLLVTALSIAGCDQGADGPTPSASVKSPPADSNRPKQPEAEPKPVTNRPAKKELWQEACDLAKEELRRHMFEWGLLPPENMNGKHPDTYVGFMPYKTMHLEGAMLVEIRPSKWLAVSDKLTDADRLNGIEWSGQVLVQGTFRTWKAEVKGDKYQFEPSWSKWITREGKSEWDPPVASIRLQKTKDKGWQSENGMRSSGFGGMFGPRSFSTMRPLDASEFYLIKLGDESPESIIVRDK